MGDLLSHVQAMLGTCKDVLFLISVVRGTKPQRGSHSVITESLNTEEVTINPRRTIVGSSPQITRHVIFPSGDKFTNVNLIQIDIFLSGTLYLLLSGSVYNDFNSINAF